MEESSGEGMQISKNTPTRRVTLSLRKPISTLYRQVLDIYTQDIVCFISSDVKKSSNFAMIVDGTQDISDKEQQSICLRYIDNNLES